MPLKNTPKILSSLDGLEIRRKKLLKLGKVMMEAYGGAMYPVDFLAFGALKRSISTIAGFKQLIQTSNMVCARTILRTQLDTALRFYSLFIVDDPHSHALEILAGKQINHMKDSTGKQMRDAYLVSKMTEEYSWVATVYKNLSGYIHFSDSHLFSSVQKVNSNARSMEFAIQEEDTKFPEFSWVELIDCMNASIDIFVKYLEGWIFTKDNPELVAKLKKERIGEPGA